MINFEQLARRLGRFIRQGCPMSAGAIVVVTVLSVMGLVLLFSLEPNQLSEYHPCRMFPVNEKTTTVPETRTGGEFGPEITVAPLSEPTEEYWDYKDDNRGSMEHEMDSWMGGQCSQIWDEWMKVARSIPPKEPPATVPKDMWKDYTLWGRIPLHKYYFDEVAVPKKVVWGKIDAQMNQTKEQLIRESTYGPRTAPLYHAMDFYRQYVDGMSGVVIGSQRPWCELYALRHGAREVTTVEYQDTEIVTTNYKMNYIHPFKMAEEWKRYDAFYDFAISYSSIEHSGLGRYGDPLDPFGDLRETSKVRCMLKPGGIFFLAVPTGKDALYWNAHRVYGPVRLPWLMRGFKLLGVFQDDAQTVPKPGIPYSLFKQGGWTNQPVLVLQKV